MCFSTGRTSGTVTQLFGACSSGQHSCSSAAALLLCQLSLFHNKTIRTIPTSSQNATDTLPNPLFCCFCTTCYNCLQCLPRLTQWSATPACMAGLHQTTLCGTTRSGPSGCTARCRASRCSRPGTMMASGMTLGSSRACRPGEAQMAGLAAASWLACLQNWRQRSTATKQPTAAACL